MRRTEATAWVISVRACSIRLSQAKTLGALVAAALGVQRATLADLGRSMLGRAKHQIKRAWRFTDNGRVEPSGTMRPIVGRLVKRRGAKLLVALDRVDVTGFQTLMASAVLMGRSVPLCWAGTTGHVYDGHRSRNAFGESLLLVLRDVTPERVKVVILADWGFGRTALATFCQRRRFGYVIRIKPSVTVRAHGFHGELLDYPVKKGAAEVLRRVAYRSDGAVTQSVVVHRPRGLPAKRDECRLLMTDQPGPARRPRTPYGRRMTVEQLFRDAKSKRNGWALRDTRIATPERFDRFLLILAIAYLLLCGTGLMAKATRSPAEWCSTTRPEECSIFTIGLAMLGRIKASPQQASATVLELSDLVSPNWG